MSNLASIFGASVLTAEAASLRVTSINAVKRVSDNDSYFYEAIQFSREMNSEYLEASKVFYKSLLECADEPHAIHEVFSEIYDFIKKIIKKAIDFITKLFHKFIDAIMKLFGSDSYITKHKELFHKFSSDEEFDYRGYNFTITSGVPANSALIKFANDIAEAYIDPQSLTPDAIKTKYTNLMNELENDWYNKARAAILGKDDFIDESDWGDELFKVFRDDSDTPEDITITSTYVASAYQRFSNYKDLKKRAEKDRKSVEDAYKKVENNFSKTTAKLGKNNTYTIDVPDSGTGDMTGTMKGMTISKDAITNMDLWMKAKGAQIQKLANLHNMAFAAKLDAIKDQCKQDRAILYKALSKIRSKEDE